MQRTISLKIDLPTEFSDYLKTCATIFSCGYREHADVNAAKNIRNNLISAAAKTQKAEQVVCQSTKCLGEPETSHQPCAGGN